MKWPSDRNTILWLMLLQLLVCLPFIAAFPIALDEPFSIYWAQQDLDVMISNLNEGNNSPLHFILLHYWIKFFGIGPISVRSLSLIFSLLLIPVLYRTARLLISQPYSVMVVLMLIASRFNHFHAMEARMYSLFLLLVMLVVYQLVNLIKQGKISIWQFVLWNCLMYYTHYLAVFVYAGEFLFLILLLKDLDRKMRINVFVGLVMIGLLILPGLLILFERISSDAAGSGWLRKPEWSELYGNIIRFFNNKVTVVLFVIPLLIFIGLSLKEKSISLKRIFDQDLLRVSSCWIGPYILMFVYSLLFSPVFLDRYLLFTTPLLYLTYGMLVVRLIDKHERARIFLLVPIIAMFLSMRIIPEINRQPDLISAYVKRNEVPGSRIVLAPPYFDLTFGYYYDRQRFQTQYSGASIFEGTHVVAAYNHLDLDTVFYKRTIFVDDNSELVYPNNGIRAELEGWGSVIADTTFEGMCQVTVFQKN